MFTWNWIISKFSCHSSSNIYILGQFGHFPFHMCLYICWYPLAKAFHRFSKSVWGAFGVSALKLWKKLPEEIRSTDSLTSWKPLIYTTSLLKKPFCSFTWVIKLNVSLLGVAPINRQFFYKQQICTPVIFIDSKCTQDKETSKLSWFSVS